MENYWDTSIWKNLNDYLVLMFIVIEEHEFLLVSLMT